MVGADILIDVITFVWVCVYDWLLVTVVEAMPHAYIHITNRQRDRQTDRQIDRQIVSFERLLCR